MPMSEHEKEILTLLRTLRARAGQDAVDALRERLEDEAVDQGHFLEIMRATLGGLTTLH